MHHRSSGHLVVRQVDLDADNPQSSAMLLVRWDPLLILDLGLHIVDGVRGLQLNEEFVLSQWM